MDEGTAFDWMADANQEIGDPSSENAKVMAEVMEREMEFARLVHQVFSTPQGADLMDRLYSLTQGAPLMQVSGSLVQGEVALAPSDWAYIREGQNSVIRFLQSQIDLARNPPTQPEVNEND